MALRKVRWQVLHREGKNLLLKCRWGTELCYDLRALEPPLGRSAGGGRVSLGERHGGWTDRPHLPGQRDWAVARSSPECSVEGKKGLPKTCPQQLGLFPGSPAICPLMALVLQHALLPMPHRPPQLAAQPSTAGDVGKLPPVPQRARAGRTPQCYAPGDAEGGDVLRRALGAKPALRLHQGGDALPCPAATEAAGTRRRRARECLQ